VRGVEPSNCVVLRVRLVRRAASLDIYIDARFHRPLTPHPPEHLVVIVGIMWPTGSIVFASRLRKGPLTHWLHAAMTRVRAMSSVRRWSVKAALRTETKQRKINPKQTQNKTKLFCIRFVLDLIV